MRANRIWSTAVVAIAVTAAPGAQSTKDMSTPSKAAMSVTYTGCVESVNHGGAFLLTKVDAMTMKQRDDMAMQGGAERKMDVMPSRSFVLAGSVNFRKHVRKKVSVTGSLSDGSMGTEREDVPTLTVKTLEVIAKSCS